MNNEYEEQGLTLSDIFFLIKKNIILISVVCVLFTLGGGIYGFLFKDTTYTATSTGIVMAVSNSNNENGYQDYMYSNYLINTFKDFLLSEPVLEDVSTKTSLPKKQIKSSVSITTQTNSLIIKITAKCSDEATSKLLADSVLDAAIKLSNSKNGTEFKYPALAEKLVDMEYSTDVTANRGAGVVIIVSFLIGCVLSFLIILVRFLTNDTFTSKEEFEKALKVNVLSLIPEINFERRQK